MTPMLYRGARGLALLVTVAAVLLASGCGSSPPRPAAPVIERGSAAKVPPRKPGGEDTRPEFYTVKRGDTLHSIALDQGVDYRDLAVWNGISDPNRISVGQQLRIRPPAPPPGAAPSATVAPLATVPSAEGKSLGGRRQRLRSPRAPWKSGRLPPSSRGPRRSVCRTRKPRSTN